MRCLAGRRSAVVAGRFSCGSRRPRCRLAAEAAANEARHEVRVRTVLRSSYSAHWRRMLSPSLGALELK